MPKLPHSTSAAIRCLVRTALTYVLLFAGSLFLCAFLYDTLLPFLASRSSFPDAFGMHPVMALMLAVTFFSWAYILDAGAAGRDSESRSVRETLQALGTNARKTVAEHHKKKSLLWIKHAFAPITSYKVEESDYARMLQFARNTLAFGMLKIDPWFVASPADSTFEDPAASDLWETAVEDASRDVKGIVKIWAHLLRGVSFEFNPYDERGIRELGETLGAEPLVRAYLAGVPLADIIEKE